MYWTDYHLHTNRSMDARDSLIKVCRYAKQKGIKEIAVTDHFEPTAKNRNYYPYNARECLFDVKRARSILKGQISIKFGIEVGQPHLYPEFAEKLIKLYPYDYVLASGHKLHGDIDFSEINYHAVDLDKYCHIYLDNIMEVAKWEHYDCIGHFDLIKRYAARQGIKIDLYQNYKHRIKEILSVIIERGKGIEVNTSGLRQYSKNCLPDYPIIKLYRQLGGNIITVGSDAHTANEVGEGIENSYKILKNAGFDHITTFERRIPNHIPINDPEENNSNDDRIIDLAVNI